MNLIKRNDKFFWKFFVGLTVNIILSVIIQQLIINTLEFLIGCGIFISLCVVVFGGVFTIVYVKEKCENRGIKAKDNTESIFYLIKQRYKSFKEKNCPIIDWVE